jgi:hypothetical protein
MRDEEAQEGITSRLRRERELVGPPERYGEEEG